MHIKPPSQPLRFAVIKKKWWNPSMYRHPAYRVLGCVCGVTAQTFHKMAVLYSRTSPVCTKTEESQNCHRGRCLVINTSCSSKTPYGTWCISRKVVLRAWNSTQAALQVNFRLGKLVFGHCHQKLGRQCKNGKTKRRQSMHANQRKTLIIESTQNKVPSVDKSIQTALLNLRYKVI